MNLSFPAKDIDEDKLALMKEFLTKIVNKKNQMIAYEYDYFPDAFSNRIELYNDFDLLEMIIGETLNSKYRQVNNNYVCDNLIDYPALTIINMLNITNRLKCLIKNNINLNLLIDRYIIEITEELELCKK